MARVVMFLVVEGYGRLVQVEGIWHVESIEEAIELVDELWEKESRARYWDCKRYSMLGFECRDKDRPDKKLNVAWIPESNDDLAKLTSYIQTIEVVEP